MAIYTVPADKMLIIRNVSASVSNQSVAPVNFRVQVETFFDGDSAGDGLVIATTTGNENVVNYAESNYYIVVSSTGAATVGSQIHGVTLEFRY